jgi:hypothetical protein
MEPEELRTRLPRLRSYITCSVRILIFVIEKLSIPESSAHRNQARPASLTPGGKPTRPRAPMREHARAPDWQTAMRPGQLGPRADP